MAKERAGNAGFGTLFLRAERVPAGGYKQILVRDDPATDKDSTPTDLEVSSGILANSHIRVELDEGGIRGISVRDEKLLGAIGLHLRQDHTDTWTFDTDRFEEPVVATLSDAEWVVEEEGPLRGRVRIEAQLDGSSIRWTLDLHRSNPRLQIKLEVSFNEKFEMMQMPIELVRASEKWLSGSGTGWAERTAAATEWPVQGWSLVESEGNHLALITHDAYSVSMNGSLWQWTLLRSPRMAGAEKIQRCTRGGTGTPTRGSTPSTSPFAPTRTSKPGG